MSFLDTVTILCMGLMIGNELMVAVFINPILLQLEEREQARVTNLFAAKLGRAMPFWYAGCLVLLIAEAVLRRQSEGFALLLTAAAIWVLVIVGTVLILVPINNRIAGLKEQWSETARQENRRWDTLHRWRVAALVVAMVCFLYGIR